MVNFLCWNSRGIGSIFKRIDLSNWILGFNISIACIFESKRPSCDEALIKSFWTYHQVKWDSFPFRGRSGEIILCWSEEAITVCSVLKKDCVIEGIEVSSGECFVFIGHHAPNSASDYIDFWKEIAEMKHSPVGMSIIMDDFNTVLANDERSGGGVFDTRRADDLKNFMEICRVVDLPIIGHEFTWFNIKSTSIIDKVLVDPH